MKNKISAFAKWCIRNFVLTIVFAVLLFFVAIVKSVDGVIWVIEWAFDCRTIDDKSCPRMGTPW